VVAIAPREGTDEREFLRLLASAERGSEHPLAGAVARAAEARGVASREPSSFEATPGIGIRATVDGRSVEVRGFDLRRAEGTNSASESAAPTARDANARAAAARGETVIEVVVDGTPLGFASIADRPRPEARDAIAKLRRAGLRVVMLSGDAQITAEAVAAQVGIDEVAAEVLPAQKAERIAQLQQGGDVVAMVGDGINDAPALAAADVGIAIGTGADVAIAASDVTLVRGDLRSVGAAIALSRATVRVMRQNLGWAFGYNVLAIPLAAGALEPVTGWMLSPVVASAAMALSSVSVVANSLRLKRAP